MIRISILLLKTTSNILDNIISPSVPSSYPTSTVSHDCSSISPYSNPVFSHSHSRASSLHRFAKWRSLNFANSPPPLTYHRNTMRLISDVIVNLTNSYIDSPPNVTLLPVRQCISDMRQHRFGVYDAFQFAIAFWRMDSFGYIAIG